MKVKYNNSFEAKRKRIQRLPKKDLEKLTSFLKYYALETIKEFYDGIKSSSLGLVALKDRTIKRKMRDSFSQPSTALYAAGDDKKDDSYINSLRMREINGFGKRGYQVYVSSKRHWKSKLKLKDLFIVHEYGTIIKGAQGQMIRIPPRPAFHKAFAKVMGRHAKKETSWKVRWAINSLIEKDEESVDLKITRRSLEGLAKFDRKD